MGVQGPLHKVPIFTGLTESEMAQVKAICFLVSGDAGHCMLREGEVVDSIYCLLSGQAAIMKQVDQNMPVVIAYVGAGAIIGELSLLDNGPASARIEATQPFKALKIDRLEFKRMLDGNALLGYKIISRIALVTTMRLRLTSGKLAQYMAVPFEAVEELDSEKAPS